MPLEVVRLKRTGASALGRGLTLTIPGELSELRAPSREPNCRKPVSGKIRSKSGLGDSGWGRAREQGLPGGTGRAAVGQAHSSGQGEEAAGAAADVPGERAAAQPAERTAGSPPQLRPHQLQVGEALEQPGRSRWGCPVKTTPQ